MNKKLKEACHSICELAKKKKLSFLTPGAENANLIISVPEKTLSLAKEAGFDFCCKAEILYMYVGTHWLAISQKNMAKLLAYIAIVGKIPPSHAKHYPFAEKIYKQFCFTCKDIDVQKPENIKINCANGTLLFEDTGITLQPFNSEDYFFSVLPYEYNKDAIAPEFKRVLDEALPTDGQMLLQEYIAAALMPRFNHQKALLLLGSGANSKSLIQSIISAALGKENIVERSIEGLCAEESRTIADLEGKLLNICSEMSQKFNLTNFKQIVAKDPIAARRLYGEPYTIYNYASLLFSCNELPRNIEYTDAYFRRLLILPFLNTIPEEKQDRTLGDRIIANELSGVLNWIIEGVERLLKQGYFTKCEIAENTLADYKIDSDSVASFLAEENYEKSTQPHDWMALKSLFDKYLVFCKEANCHSCSLRTFSARLKLAGFDTTRKSYGTAVCARKTAQEAPEPPVTLSPEWPDIED